MEFQAFVRNFTLVGILFATLAIGVTATNDLETIADRLDTATIGGTRVPAVECAEDEVISWLGVDTLGCVHYENLDGE